MGITREISTSDDLPEGYRPFQAAIDYIRDNLGSEIRIPELSRLCNLSSSQFRRRFKSVFHLAPAEFILRTRLQAAARRLGIDAGPDHSNRPGLRVFQPELFQRPLQRILHDVAQPLPPGLERQIERIPEIVPGNHAFYFLRRAYMAMRESL